MSERGEYRRPPSDVDNMISLRVDNLPYRTHQEVRDSHYDLSWPSIVTSLIVAGPEASV